METVLDDPYGDENMLPTNPVDVVRAMYAAFEARDESQLRTLIDSEVEWNQCEGFPGGARRTGLDDVLASVFGGNRATWNGFAAPVTEYIAAKSDSDKSKQQAYYDVVWALLNSKEFTFNH